MTGDQTRSGMAAFSSCEALLLVLNDAQILLETEILGVFKDAAATHENALGSEIEVEVERHRAAAATIRRIISAAARDFADAAPGACPHSVIPPGQKIGLL